MKTSRQAVRAGLAEPQRFGPLNRFLDPDRYHPARLIAPLAYAVLLAFVFGQDLLALVEYSIRSDLYSHILLIPFISAGLIYMQNRRLPWEYASSPGFAVPFLLTGGAILWITWSSGNLITAISYNDCLALKSLSFICFLVAAGFLFLGGKWMQSAAFPVAILIFMVPFPDCVLNWIETGFTQASAVVAHLLFIITGTPVLQDGVVIQLPGIVIRVAQECSGIRSSLVLFITCILAGNIFLKSPWRRGILVSAAILFGIIRNGFRILVVGLLCVHKGPNMIHSVIHTQGGPFFFVLTLVPMFFLLWCLRAGEQGHDNLRAGSGSGKETEFKKDKTACG